MEKTCEWKPDDDNNFDTGCKNRFVFIDEGPIENGFEFCPYCGNRLIIQMAQGFGHCKEYNGCKCGGDAMEIRMTCQNWVKP